MIVMFKKSGKLLRSNFKHALFALLMVSISSLGSEKSPPLIKVAVDPFPPWVIVEEDGSLRGIDIQITRAITEQLNLSPEFIVCPFARCLKMMESGDVDLMVNLFKTEERKDYIQFSEQSILPDPPKVFYLKFDSKLDITQYEHLMPLKIGTVRGTAYFDKFDGDSSLIKIQAVQDSQLIEMLLRDRVDTFIGTESTIDYILASQRISHLFKKASFRWQGQNQTFLGVSRKSPLLKRMTEINDVLSHFKSQGTFETLERN